MLSKTNGMVATAMSPAAEAGLRILRSGGNAIDAVVATALAISVVDPGDSGLGGAGLATIYLRGSDEVLVVDFNAVCPSLGSETPYELLEGISEYTGYRRVKDDSNVRGYRSISVPGLLAGLDLLLNEYGSKKLSDLVQPALKLARDGFRANRYVAEYIDGSYDAMGAYPGTAKIFAPDGPPRVGDKIVQADLAGTLKTISREGSHAFYHGRVADRIVDSMEKNGGLITGKDLAGYKARVSKPATTKYRGYEISAPPVGAGGNALLEALNIVENADFGPMSHYSPEMVHLLIETLKLVWADRLAYDADPQYAKAPLQGLLSKEYAKARFREIDPGGVIADAKAGDPWKYDRGGRGKSSPRGYTGRLPRKDSHTTQITVVDKDRNMVSLTQTVWDTFGSLVTIPDTGIVMNNGQSRLDPEPHAANRPETGKRVLSNMCPIIVTKDGEPIMAAGSPGGRRIIATLLSFLVSVIDYGMDSDSLNLPRFHCETGEPVLVESAWIDRAPVGTARLLEKRGHKLQLVPVTGSPNGGYPYISGPASAIMVGRGGSLSGTADSRQPGSVKGY